MAEALTIDPVVFWERLNKLHKTWNAERKPDGLWNGADALVIDSGALNEDEVYSKSAALQIWLLGIEFTNTIIVICSRSIHILTDAKKVTLLSPLKSAENATIPLELHVKDKTDKFKAKFAALVSAIRSSHAGAAVAFLMKEKPQGEFSAQWRAALKDEEGLQQVELAPALARVQASKDADEQACVKRAAILSAELQSKHLVPRIETVIDEQSEVTHEKLAIDAEEALGDPAKLGLKLNKEHIEACYTPIIQSGGSYNLKPSAFSDEKKLHGGTITTSLGARYKAYCSNVGRTYIINPSKEQERNYKLLLELQQEAIDALKIDVKLSAVYTAVQTKLRNKAQVLEGNLTKDCGFVMGLEFREPSLLLNAKCDARVLPGMVFNVAVGLDNLEASDVKDAKAKKYALFLADTVLIGESGAPEVLTSRAPKAWKEVSYYLNEEDEAEETSKPSKKGKGNVEILQSRTRGKDHAKKHVETSEALNGHQQELEEKMREEAIERLRNGSNRGTGSSAVQETQVAYRDPSQFPSASSSGSTLRTNQTFVDQKQEAVLIPVFGRLVPFHVSTIKSVSKHEEGAWTFLRINFVAPGVAGAASQQLPKEAGKDAHYIREVTLKAKVATNLNTTFRLIKELRKRVQMREKQVALEADLVTQEALQLIRTGKVHRLRDVHVRPNLGGKKAAGTLELHVNGLRFQAPRGEKLDLIFTNIKLAFFQPAEKEIMVLLHFHLHNPIMIGKKKTKDVQFYVEVMEASYALDNARRSGYDPDELEEEQRERALRNRMNQEFSNFSKKIEDQAKELEFDIPYRELGFYGVPPHNKSSSFIMPAVNALVELTEPPWFVMPLSDIEIAHFERVVYGLKNFDLVLVFKDFAQKPVHVNAINTEHLDALKTWLDSCNIKFYEGTANLNWNSIMKHINDTGVEGFYEDGGWKFLNMQGSSDEDEEDPEDAESDFEPEGSGEEEEESDDDDDDDFDSEDDSEASGRVDGACQSHHGSGSAEDSLGSDQSEGQDWDEAEEEADKDDKKRARERAEKEGKEGPPPKKGKPAPQKGKPDPGKSAPSAKPKKGKSGRDSDSDY